MITEWIFLIVGVLIWIEFLIAISACIGKNSSYLTAMLIRPFGIPMPSMFLGVAARVLLIAVGSVGIVKFF